VSLIKWTESKLKSTTSFKMDVRPVFTAESWVSSAETARHGRQAQTGQRWKQAFEDDSCRPHARRCTDPPSPGTGSGVEWVHNVFWNDPVWDLIRVRRGCGTCARPGRLC